MSKYPHLEHFTIPYLHTLKCTFTSHHVLSHSQSECEKKVCAPHTTSSIHLLCIFFVIHLCTLHMHLLLYTAGFAIHLCTFFFTPLHLYTFAPFFLHLYTYTPLHLYNASSLHLRCIANKVSETVWGALGVQSSSIHRRSIAAQH